MLAQLFGNFAAEVYGHYGSGEKLTSSSSEVPRGLYSIDCSDLLRSYTLSVVNCGSGSLSELSRTCA